jgi:hypothetical protein
MLARTLPPIMVAVAAIYLSDGALAVDWVGRASARAAERGEARG